ncbi:hypothetical protein V0R50_27345 [Pseudomonas sp. 148P]|uniref:Uncharacterized protein n=1 Tax=Pseudomonas ulcerans TaxID=3115852 RepID=A0ABU7HZE5_9PSED|nr:MULTISPECIES: hypothetical protein [unclassified Pseudomonas]MEE1925016.1 hypothetical protein [Pseudomonas sp. 147P]MEE1936955.1 hypothetical protein [Pseudomonas sp. 148P]
MNTITPGSAAKLIELEFSSTDLYPPLKGSSALVMVSMAPQAPKDLSFQLLLNGQAGTPAGMRLDLLPEEGSGNLLVERAFIEQYQGIWPAQLKLRALRDGVVLDEAILTLHDTRRIAPTRMEANVDPSTTIVIPTSGDAWVTIVPTFFDRNDVLLPLQELNWFVQLYGQPVGVVHRGHVLQITPRAEPGKVQAMLHSGYGLQLTITLTLELGTASAPTEEFELEVSHRHLYAPVSLGTTALITYEPARPVVGVVRYVVKVNGQEHDYPGMVVTDTVGTGQKGSIRLDSRFLATFQGTWPVVVSIEVMHNFKPVATGEVVLHNLRTGLRPPVRAEWNSPPAGSPITIPTDQAIHVIAMVFFYDENGAQLPYREPELWQWSVDLPTPYEGIGMIKHVIEVTPQARPGQFELVASESKGLTSRMTFTLV